MLYAANIADKAVWRRNFRPCADLVVLGPHGSRLLRTDAEDLQACLKLALALVPRPGLTCRLLLVHLDAIHVAGVGAVVVVHRYPEGVDGLVAQVLLILTAPPAAVAVHIHVELVDASVVGVHDVERHVGPVVRVDEGRPGKLRVTRLTAVGAVAHALHSGVVIDIVVDGHGVGVGAVVAVAIASRHPVRIPGGIAQALAVREHPRALLTFRLHVEVVGVVVVRVVDVQLDLGLVVRAVNHGTPHELGLTRGAPARSELQHVEGHVAFVVDVAEGLVVTGVAAAVLLAFAVVPAARLHRHDARHGFGDAGFGVLVEGEVQVRARMLSTAAATHVAGITNRAEIIVVAQALARLHVDLGEVGVAAHVVALMAHQYGVAVAGIAIAFVLHINDLAIRHRGHGLAVGTAAALRKVESEAVVTPLEAVVLVAAGLVALRHDPVLTGREGQVQRDIRAAQAILVVVDVGTTAAEHEAQHQEHTHQSLQHKSPPFGVGFAAGSGPGRSMRWESRSRS